MTGDPIVWWELASHDAEKSVEFFQKVFGWKIDFDERVGFFKTRAEPSKLDGGGIFTLRRAKLPFLTLYIQVDDIHEKAKLIQENGGFILEPSIEITAGEYICLFNEPSGVTFAMIQENK